MRLRSRQAVAAVTTDRVVRVGRLTAEAVAPLVDRQVSEVRGLGRLGDASTLLLLEALTGAHEAKLEIVEEPKRTRGRKPALELSGDADPVLFERLREWRRAAAQAAAVPAYVVATDRTLVADHCRPIAIAE